MDDKRVNAGIVRSFGHDAEREVITELKQLPNPWALAYNVLLPARYRNNAPDETDIILIGPPGIYSIEVKYWMGLVSGDLRSQWVYRTIGYHKAEPWANPAKIATTKKSILYSTLQKCLRGERVPPVMGAVIFPRRTECQLNISAPPFALDIPLLNLDQAVAYFAHPSRVTNPRERLDQPQIDRIFNLICAQPVEPLTTQSTVGSYQIEKVLLEKETAYYLPYIAHNVVVPTQKALVKKLKLAEYLPDDEYNDIRRKLTREAEVLLKLSGHRNIVQLYGPFSHAGDLYIAYEWIDGTSLAEMIKSQRYKPEDMLRLMLRVIETMRLVHERDVIHRGLSPDCIIYAQDKTLKITDFGAARLLQSPSLQQQRMSALQVSPYVAPEAVLDTHAAEAEQNETQYVRYGKSVDIYALGAICYTIVTGHPPASPLQRGDDKLAFDGARFPVSKEIQTVIEKAMALAPGRRYADVRTMFQDMKSSLP